MSKWPPAVEPAFKKELWESWITKLKMNGELEATLAIVNRYRVALGGKPYSLKEYINITDIHE